MLEWRGLVGLSNEELARLDTEAVNFACAAGLPGAEHADLERCRRTVGEWARAAHRETCRLYPLLERDPAEFQHSKAVFRCAVMVTVLQRDVGVRYNAALVERDDFFVEAENLFLHGVIRSRRGTCTSLPALYLAVGRRLGYPLKLVRAKSHLFARWDDGQGERFNVECTALGFVSHPDGYYLQWPFPTTAQEAEEYGLLRSMAPREELACYLGQRGHCWLDNERHREAVEAYAWATEVDPESHLNSSSLCAAMNRWRARLRESWPEGFPPMTIHFPPRQFQNVPLNLERAILHLETMERILGDKEWTRRWWEPLRWYPGRPPADVPESVTVEYAAREAEPAVTFYPRPGPTDFTNWYTWSKRCSTPQ